MSSIDVGSESFISALYQAAAQGTVVGLYAVNPESNIIRHPDSVSFSGIPLVTRKRDGSRDGQSNKRKNPEQKGPYRLQEGRIIFPDSESNRLDLAA